MKKVLMILIISLSILILIGIICLNKLRPEQELENVENIINTNNDIKHENITNVENNEFNNDTQEKVLTKTINDSNYYTIINCIDSFLTNVRKKENNVLIDLLDNNYVKSQNISVDNISKYIKYMGEYQKIYVYEMYEDNEYSEITKYYVKGKLSIGYNKEKNIDVCFIVSIDYFNYIYSIIPCYEGQVQPFEISDIREKFAKNTTEQTKNNNNELEIKLTTDEYMAKEYFYNFQYMIIHDYQNLYNRIDEDYKKKRFSSVDEYKQYIKDNYNHFENMTLKEYSVDKSGPYIEYVCFDNHNNYYTIKVNSVMDYKIILDDYTIETERFIELYNNLDEEKKVYTNIEKFIKMINNKDYSAAYSVLDDEFKKQNFKKVSLFKDYIQNNFFDYINVENISEFKQTGMYYICKVEMTTGSSLSAEQDVKTFIMELTEGTGFRMSFSID